MCAYNRSSRPTPRRDMLRSADSLIALADKPLGPEFSHAGTPRRLAALSAVASETGATANQVVLAWLMGGELPVIPLVGASSVAQLEESLGAVDLTLTTEQRERLDQAG